MVNALLEIGDKWNIGNVDLWNNPEMRKIGQTDYNKYMKDCVHPNKLGYREWWRPEFIEALNKMFYSKR